MSISENVPRILAISCLILGSYILIAYLFTQTQKIPPFHLGCFSSNHSLDHHSRLANIVHQIQEEFHNETSIAYLHQEADYGNEVELAKRFQRYVQVAMHSRQNQHANNQLISELSKAQQQFFSCHQQIDNTYSSVDCLQEYKDYQLCGENLKKLHSKFINATNFQQALMAKIQNSLSETKGVNHSDKEKLQLAQRKYQLRILQLDRLRLPLIKENQKLLNHLTTIKFEITDLSKKFETAKSSYELCSLHRQDFILCQQITAQVQTLGIDSMNELNERIQKKRDLCQKLMKLVTESKTQQTLNSNRAIFNRNLQELKDLMRISITTSIKNKENKCGCQVEKEEELRKSKEELQSLLFSLRANLSQTQNRLVSIHSQLQAIEAKRSDAQKEYEDQINKATAESSYEVVHFNKSLLIDLENANRKILDLKDEYSNLQIKCQQLQIQLSVRLGLIDKISSCLSKKQYFLKLKDEVNKHIRPDTNGNEVVVKEALLRTLQKIGRKNDDTPLVRQISSKIDDL